MIEMSFFLKICEYRRADSEYLVTQFSRCQAWLFGAGDRARDVEKQPFAVLAQSHLQRGLQFPALCADAGGQEPEIGGCGADAFHCFDMGGADHETDIVLGVPGLCKFRNMLI